jgi:hypothetical protein
MARLGQLVDFRDERLVEASKYVPDRFRFSALGAIRDTVALNVLAEYEWEACGRRDWVSYYIVVTSDGDTLRIISRCVLPRVNERTHYVTLSVGASARFVAAEPILHEVELPDFGNVYPSSDTMPLPTAFGTPIHAVRRIPADLAACMRELDTVLCSETKEMVRDAEPGGLHFGLGLWIRNSWASGHGSDLVDFFGRMGITERDHISGIVLSAYQRHLRGVPVDSIDSVEVCAIRPGVPGFRLRSSRQVDAPASTGD